MKADFLKSLLVFFLFGKLLISCNSKIEKADDSAKKYTESNKPYFSDKDTLEAEKSADTSIGFKRREIY